MERLFVIRRNLLIPLCLIPLICTPLRMNAQAAPAQGAVQEVTVHGASLEGNLLGDSPDRHVMVYLPPSCDAQPNRRYPVVYMLHGFTDSDFKWFGGAGGWMKLKQVADEAIAGGASKEMILVVPNAFNKMHGAFYSDSVTTGDWEDFIVHDLVAYVDQHYRTIARPESRGLAGHSMGGYGTMRIGMKHPEVFSNIYALSPCCLVGMDSLAMPKLKASSANIHDFADIGKTDFYTMILYAIAAAWSPDPKNPPFYLDLPFGTPVPEKDVVAKWNANMPMVLLDQHVPDLKRLHAIAFDAGKQDDFKAIPASLIVLDRILTSYGIAHTYETYEGTHTSRIPQRIGGSVLPFFTKNLSFDEPPASSVP